MLKKKLINITGILILMGVLAGCKTDTMMSIYQNQTKIAETSNTFGYDKIEQRIDDGTFTVSYNKLNGMDTVWVYEAKEDVALNISYDFQVSKGKAKLVHILPDKGIQTIIEKTKDKSEGTEHSTIALKKGTNRIKIVAKDNADIKFYISLPAGEYTKMGM